MLRMIVHKILYLIPILFVVSLATFFMQELVPGDPVFNILGPNATIEQVENLRLELGLDKPVVERYVDWLSHAVRGDFGNSLLPPIQDVGNMVQSRLPVTLELAVVAMLMSLLLSIPVALYSAYRAGYRFDRVASSFAFAIISVPSFVMALLLVFLLVFHPGMARWSAAAIGVAGAVWLAYRAVRRNAADPGEQPGRQLARGAAGAVGVALVTLVLVVRWPEFPRQGFSRLLSGDGIGSNLRHVFLPAFTLALTEAAVFMRLLRADLMSTLQEDFILFARAKGMAPRRILVSDALRPSAFSLITVAGVSFGRLIGGTVIVETIFNLPGMGTMIVKAVGAGDFRVVQAGVVVIAAFYVVINTVIDISYAYLDPRMRRGK